MPGLMLKRSHEQMEAGSKGPGPSLQNPESTDSETPRKKQMLDKANGVHHLTQREESNGASSGANGTDKQDVQAKGTTNPLSVIQSVANDLPPEIEQVPVESYWPFSLLVERLAQNTFEGLHDVIDDLAESSQFQVNGAGPAGAQQLNTERKAKLWSFAQESRAKFVKLLVLSQWSRSAESIMRVIDINQYLTKQKINYEQAHRWVGALKTVLASQNVPAPDIKATLHVLAEGNASWISDLGYVPSPPLSASEALDTLRKINKLLTIRLSLHQKPPESLNDYEVHDGRVTFKVSEEFELDLSIGSEDHTEQLYFLDFRFTFSPGGGRLRENRTRDQIENRINYILKTQGLSECYDFLHDLTLTHKLSILRSQARKLVASRWSDSVSVEIVHRALILQYWTNRTGGKRQKNWIEVGVKKKRPEDEAHAGAPNVSHLSIRWHRHGKEVLDHGIEVDPSDISLETILKDTLAAHSNYIFSGVKRDLDRGATPLNAVFNVKQHQSPIEPADCTLEITFPDSKTVTLAQEPVSGNLAFLPASNLHRWFDTKLQNLSDPANQAADIVRQLRAATASDRSQRLLAMIGWTHVPVPKVGPQTLQAYFHQRDVYRVEYCRPPHWSGEWCLALSHHLSGFELWHLVRLKGDMNAALSSEDVLLGREKSPFKSVMMICSDPGGGNMNGVKALPGSHKWNFRTNGPLQTTQMPPEDTTSKDVEDSVPNKYDFLLSLAAHGAAIASQFTNGVLLENQHKSSKHSQVFALEPSNPNSQLRPIVPRDDDGPEALNMVSVASIRLRLWDNELTECYKKEIRTYVAGVYPGDGTIVTITHAELLQPLPMSTETLQFPGGAFQVSNLDNHQLAVQLSVKMGQPVVQDLMRCLHSFSKMMNGAKCLQQQSLDVSKIELNRIDVSLESLNAAVISRGHPLSAEQLRVTFSRSGAEERHSIDEIEFGKDSPHARNIIHWRSLLRNWGIASASVRLKLVHEMTATVTEMSKQNLPVRPYISFRDTAVMRLIWGRENLGSVALDIALVKKESDVTVWRVKLNKKVANDGETPAAISKIEDTWKNEIAYKTIEGCEGIGGAITVQKEVVSSAMWHVFDTLKSSIENFYETTKEDNKQPAEPKKEGGDKKQAIEID